MSPSSGSGRLVGVLCEKSSAAKNFAAALGAGMSGTAFNGESYVITHARGHLYEFAEPHKMVPADRAEAYASWESANLPWDTDELSWDVVPIPDTSKDIARVRAALSGVDEIVIACDVDPSGEGGMIAANVIKCLGLTSKKISRMYFTDEAKASLRKGFESRVQIDDLDAFDEYRKALYRSQFDLASMQFTRIATHLARSSGQNVVLRQGRLKSAMVRLVGDQLEAYNSYVKKPFFQNRFRDEHGVVYTNPDEPCFDAATQVPQTYSISAVVHDEVTRKASAPPRLLDLAALASAMGKKGIKADVVLKTYQNLYEAGIASYPRTEDKTVTPEQFAELLPKVDKIAAVVGVDTALLTHREPRRTHVKPVGAHGANRPGLTVPDSLASLSKYGPGAAEIYTMLARNYLAMLAGDYLYDHHAGHLETYPAFTGSVNVMVEAGWKAVFVDSSGTGDDDDEDTNAAGLGSQAEPFVFEGANKRPPHPSMSWLMKQLAKRDVGTGATRTSTYAEVTNARSKYPLMVEKGSKLTLSHAGEMSHLLLAGTHIGDLTLTERVYAQMAQVAAGQQVGTDLLRQVASLVRDDLVSMTSNATSMRTRLGLSEVDLSTFTGQWVTAPGGPRQITMKRTSFGHRFTDEEVEALLTGQEITFEGTSKTGKPFTARGALGVRTYKGKRFVGFELTPNHVPGSCPASWAGHTFTDDEKAVLIAGGEVVREDWLSKAGRAFSCPVKLDAATGKIEPQFNRDDAGVPRSWCSVTFTDAQRTDLEAGRSVSSDAFKSKKGSTFSATLYWKPEKPGGPKKLVPEFAPRR